MSDEDPRVRAIQVCLERRWAITFHPDGSIEAFPDGEVFSWRYPNVERFLRLETPSTRSKP